MWKCFWLLLVFCLQRSVVISLSLCEGNGVLECDETRNFSTFTCTGFTSQQTAWWQMMYDSQIVKLGSCPPLTGVTSTCIPGSQSKVFQISRTSGTASSISAFSGTSLSALSDKGSLTCSSQEGNDETSCPLDFIYRASGSMCEVYFSTVSTWSVVVNCSINKTRSVRRRYSCQLRQHDQVSGTTVLLPAVQLSVTQTSPDGYVSGVCNITSFLPSEGRYRYEVTITPGNVNVSANFLGSNIIRRPAESLTHNCPQHVTEGADLNCQCAVSELGSPPGTLQWNITVSSQLSLKGLRREQHGENYVCSLTWNRTVQQSLTYTLIITYPPTSMSFKLDNSVNTTMTVVENTVVTMLCQCDGRPTPNMTITDVTNDNRVLESLQGGNITLAELGHTITLAQCEDSGQYRCAAENGLGRTFQSVKLFVKCIPRKASTDANHKPPTIFEGQNASFQLIAYPTPVNVTKYFLGSNMCSCETPASDDIFRVDCSSSSKWLFLITCTVTVIKVSPHAAGLYKAVVRNELGGVALIFEALPRNTTESEKCDDLISAEFSRGQKSGLGIGLGVAVAEAVIFAILVLVFFWRRKRQTSNTRGGRKNTAYSSREDILSDKTTELNSLRSSGHDKNEQESAYEAISSGETGQTAAYTNVEGSVLSRKTSNKPGDLYDGLRLHDVGVSSPYASLS